MIKVNTGKIAVDFDVTNKKLKIPVSWIKNVIYFEKNLAKFRSTMILSKS